MSPLPSPSHPTRAMMAMSSSSPSDGDHTSYRPSSSMMPTSDTASAADDHGHEHHRHHLHENHHHHHNHHHHPPGPRSLRLKETDVVFGTKGNGRNQLFLKELERQSFRYRVMSKADKMELIQTIIRDWPGDFYVWKSGDGDSSSSSSSSGSKGSGPGHIHDRLHDHDHDDDDDEGSHHEKLTLIKASSTSSSSPNGPSSSSSPMSRDKKLNEGSCPIRLYTSVRRMMNYVITKHKQQPASGTSTGSTGNANTTANKGLVTKADVSADVARGARGAGPTSTNLKKMKDSKKRRAKQITESTTASSSGSAVATAAVKKSNQARKSKKLKAVSPKKATASPSPFEVGVAGMAAMIRKKTTKKVKRVVHPKTKVKTPKTLKIDASKHYNFSGGSLKIQSHDIVSSPRTTATTTIAGPSGGGNSTTMMTASVVIVSPEPSPRGIHVPLNIGMRPQQLQHEHHHNQSDQSFSGIIPMLQPYGGGGGGDVDGSDSLGCQFAFSTLWSPGNKTKKRNINAKKKKKTTTKRKSKTSSLHRRSKAANKPTTTNETLYMRSLEDEAISTLISFRRTS